MGCGGIESERLTSLAVRNLEVFIEPDRLDYLGVKHLI